VTNCIDRAIAAGLAASLRVNVRAIVYHRDDDSLSFSAIKGKTIEQAVDGQAVVAEVEHADWIFKVSELADLTPATPGKGDWIEDAAGTRYDVCERTGTGWWKHVDPAKTWVRVMTTETE
jgi:hypothetical protein